MKTYLVGGAVRDKFLGLAPKDRDWVIVGATPANVERMLLDGYTRVGADFPVFLHPITGEEYALARVERKVAPGYHGFIVEADEHVTIEQDLARRDLTMNSMAIGDDGVLIDPFHGLSDLHNHVLRHTTAAFSEDPLRVLRLARFAARFRDFKIAPATIELCRELCAAGELDHLSSERIWAEIDKGLGEQYPVRFLEVLSQTHALQHCKIAQSAFGSVLTDQQRRVCGAITALHPEERFTVGVVALAFSAECTKLIGANNRVLDCYRNIQAFAAAPYGATEFYSVLKNAGALREGPAFKDLVFAATLLEVAGYRQFKFISRQLISGQKAVKSVRAEQFAGFLGKELGQQIEAHRVLNLERALGIPRLKSLAPGA